eukprot:s14_g41.t1
MGGDKMRQLRNDLIVKGSVTGSAWLSLGPGSFSARCAKHQPMESQTVSPLGLSSFYAAGVCELCSPFYFAETK